MDRKKFFEMGFKNSGAEGLTLIKEKYKIKITLVDTTLAAKKKVYTVRFDSRNTPYKIKSFTHGLSFDGAFDFVFKLVDSIK